MVQGVGVVEIVMLVRTANAQRKLAGRLHTLCATQAGNFLMWVAQVVREILAQGCGPC